MEIQLHLPRSFDAEVVYDPDKRIVTIVPNATRGTVPLIGVETVSTDKKRTEKTMINFNLGKGKPELQNRRGGGASFDEVEEQEKPT